MNRKGFTLVELLATLVILGIVTGIVFASVNGVFNNTKAKSEDVFVGTIKDALDIYLTSSDAKGLDFSVVCSNKLSKSFGSRKVYKTTITFNDVINSQYKPITESDLVNPANEDAVCNSNAVVTIYRDEDYVYYYSVSKSSFGCLSYTDVDDLITNLPEGFECF